MNNPEKATEDVLAALRSVQAPTHLDRRILLALEQAAAAPTPFWRRLAILSSARPALRSVYAGTIAAACLAAIALLLPALHRHTPTSTPNLRTMPAALPLPTAFAEAKAAPPPRHPRPIAHAASARPPRPQPSLQTGPQTYPEADESTATAAREMQASSLPAPPLPLTPQEKLLLRIAHRGAPEQKAMLNPQLRLQQEEQSKAEFKDFFDPPEPKQNQ